jgi:hypothetical protein
MVRKQDYDQLNPYLCPPIRAISSDLMHGPLTHHIKINRFRSAQSQNNPTKPRGTAFSGCFDERDRQLVAGHISQLVKAEVWESVANGGFNGVSYLLGRNSPPVSSDS